MSRREEASKLNSKNIGRREKGSGHCRRHYIRSLCCAWHCRSCSSAAVETGNLTCSVAVGGHHFAIGLHTYVSIWIRRIISVRIVVQVKQLRNFQ